MTTNEDWIP